MNSAGIGAPPKLSCLMPIYNGEAFLLEAIDSILDQTFADFELIAVDDGSTDNTPAILADFAAKDPRVRIVAQSNGGIVSALNAGLAVCRGEYVARMDADDVALPHRFAFQSAYLDANPGCVLVGGLATTRRADGSHAGSTSGGWHSVTDLAPFPPRIAVSIHPLITVRREALVKIGGYRKDFPHAEDYDLFIRLAEYGSIDNPKEVVLFYRRHEGALSIRHVERQEASAARAEMTARAERGIAPTPDWLLAAYIRLRIWRRYRTVDLQRAREMLPSILGDLFDLRPRALFSADHWGVRTRIAASVVRMAITRAKALARSIAPGQSVRFGRDAR